MKKVPILCALMLCGAQAANAAVYTGTCGASLAACTWSFNDVSGELTISGNGAMNDWDRNNMLTIPWYNYSSSIKSIVISGVTTIGALAFAGCSNVNLIQVVIPSSVTSIGAQAFQSCTFIKQVTIPNSVTSIGAEAFRSCANLTSVTIPGSVNSMGNNIFTSCSKLLQVTIQNGVTSISGAIFASCSALTSVTIPSSVTSIGGNAFSACGALTSVTIPSSVTSIGSAYVFYKCTSLTQIICLMPTPASIEALFFTDVPRNIPLYVPSGSVSLYRAAAVWSTFTNIIAAPEVTFNSQGGSVVAKQPVAPNTKAVQPAAPSKSGYVFCGWYRETNCVNEWNFNNAVTGNITLYAKWQLDEITITYKCEGVGCNPDFGVKQVQVRGSQ